MAGHQPPPSGPDRLRQITTGLADHSLSVLAVGLGVLPT